MDDGSEDNMYDVVLLIRDFRFKVFRIVYGGKLKVLNFGLFKVRGEIIVIIDVDSVFEKSVVKEFVRRFYLEDVFGVGG